MGWCRQDVRVQDVRDFANSDLVLVPPAALPPPSLALEHYRNWGPQLALMAPPDCPHPGSYQQDQDHGALVDVVGVNPRPFAKPASRRPQTGGERRGHPVQFGGIGEGRCLARAGLGLETRLRVPKFQPWQKVKPLDSHHSAPVCSTVGIRYH